MTPILPHFYGPRIQSEKSPLERDRRGKKKDLNGALLPSFLPFFVPGTTSKRRETLQRCVNLSCIKGVPRIKGYFSPTKALVRPLQLKVGMSYLPDKTNAEITNCLCIFEKNKRKKYFWTVSFFSRNTYTIPTRSYTST